MVVAILPFKVINPYFDYFPLYTFFPVLISNSFFYGDVLVFPPCVSAKNPLSARADASSEKTDGEKIKFFDNSEESFSGKRKNALNEMSETERESDGVEARRKEGVLRERKANLSTSSSSRSENGDILNDCSGSRGFEEPGPSRYDQGRYRRPSKAPVENYVYTNKLDSHSDELIRANVKENGEAIASIGNARRFQKFGQMRNRSASERDGSLAFHREWRAAVDGSRYSPYADEGPSNRRRYSAHENGEQTKNQSIDESGRAVMLEKDRAELLRKIDELRNQISRSCDVSDNPKEKVPADRRMVPPNAYNAHEAWPSEGCASAANGSLSQLYPDNPIRRPLYLNNDQHGPSMGRHDLDLQNCYPPMDAPNDIKGYRESYGPQVPRRDPVILYPPYGFYEQQPPCSCLHCYTKHSQMHPQIPPAVFNRQFPSAATNHMFYHVDNPSTYGPGVYNRTNPPLNSFDPQPHLRKPSDLEYDMGGFRRSQPQRSVLAKGNRRSCRPIAGGAPFITCCNCLKLLQLPQKLSLRERNQCNLQCGACSNPISFTLDGKRFVFACTSQTKDLLPKADNDTSDGMKEGLHVNGYIANGTLKSNLYNYDSFIYSIESTDPKPISSPPFVLTSDDPMGKEGMLNSSESEKRQGFSSSSFSSEDDVYPDRSIAQRDVSNSTVNPSNVDTSSPVAGLRLREHFEYSPANQVMDKFGKGNSSKRSDQESVFPSKGNIRQNSVKDASVATEIDCSYNEYPISGISQDSVEASKEDRHKLSKGNESFLVGLIKKSFKDFGRSNQSSENDQPSVSINGQPIPDRLVRKAERKAGRIQPGQYW